MRSFSISLLQKLFATERSQNPAPKSKPRRARRVQARYDAAQSSNNNRRHWEGADGHSANAANSPSVRRTLRNRARYEVANNSYADGIVQTLANDIVGTGPRLQMLGLSAADNRLIERLFTDWSNASHLADTLQTMRHARTCDGESFAIFIENPTHGHPVTLDLRLIEADQVCTPDFDQHSNINTSHVDGITFDDYGNPKYYHILESHPGDGINLLCAKVQRIAAINVLHDFRVKRPGQERGIPEITAALPLFAMLRDYSLATLDAAKAAAYFAGVLYTDAPANGEADEVEAMDAISLERNMLVTMPSGWKLGQMKSEQPTASYSDFKHEILNEIARCLNMPFNVAAGNSSGYNFASGRLDHQTYYKSITVDRKHIERRILDRIFTKWLQEAILIEGYLPQRLRNVKADFHHQWFWDGTEHVDPLKEANAQKVRLLNHTTTLADEFARKGQDWEAQLQQRAKEIEMMNALGLIPEDITPSAPSTVADVDIDEVEDEGSENNNNNTKKNEETIDE
ncbi:MAG: phage portal protein [Planctomycetes bacterium]|nr:phage portal protein [Planctomycetota bacterium]